MIVQPHTRTSRFQLVSIIWIAVAGAVALLAAYLPVGPLVSRQNLDAVGIAAVFAMAVVTLTFSD
jgi:hypothetical protein